MEDNADYRYVTDFELSDQELFQFFMKNESLCWLTIKSETLCVHNSARHRTLLKMTKTHVNQVLPSETSTQEGGDKIPSF